ncbi:hypothetical protein Droror1_Dr00027837, partial [Drosera rotundifolia]
MRSSRRRPDRRRNGRLPHRPWNETSSGDGDGMEGLEFEFRSRIPDSGDKLVVVDFFSPGCGGCKALHPKAYRIRSFYISNRICM